MYRYYYNNDNDYDNNNNNKCVNYDNYTYYYNVACSKYVRCSRCSDIWKVQSRGQLLALHSYTLEIADERWDWFKIYYRPGNSSALKGEDRKLRSSREGRGGKKRIIINLSAAIDTLEAGSPDTRFRRYVILKRIALIE